MLNKEKHQLMMGMILRDLYSDTSIAPLLGFKGGTCARLFYGLPRFSVDLDFDLFSTKEKIQSGIFTNIQSVLEHYGELKDTSIKRFTLFFLLSYGDADHNIKIEINKRALMPDLKSHYILKEYLGISMLVEKNEYLFANKLLALTRRHTTAMRDIYDIWFFAKQNWNINAKVIHELGNTTILAQLSSCIAVVEQVKDNQILQGLGELLDEKQKTWVKTHLRKDVIFLLKNYQSALAITSAH